MYDWINFQKNPSDNENPKKSQFLLADKKYKLSLSYLMKCESLHRQHNDLICDVDAQEIYDLRGMIHADMGALYQAAKNHEMKEFQGKNFIPEKQFDRALKSWKTCLDLAIARVGRKSRLNGIFLTKIGSLVFWPQEKYGKALRYYRDALEAFRSVRKDFDFLVEDEYADAVHNVGMCKMAIGNQFFKESMQHFEEYRDVAKKRGRNSPKYAQALHKIGTLFVM